MELNKKGNIRNFSILIILSILFSIYLVNAEITSTRPVTNQIINGTYNFTLTVTNWEDANFTNLTVFRGTSATATNTLVCSSSKPGNATASGSGQTKSPSCTANTSLISDSLNGIYFNFTLTSNVSETTIRNSTIANTVTVDNTAPTVSISVENDVISYMGGTSIDCSGSTDTIDTLLTYNFTLYYENNGLFLLKKSVEKANSTDGKYEILDDDWFDISATEYLLNCKVSDDAINVGWGTNQSIRTSGSKETIQEKQQKNDQLQAPSVRAQAEQQNKLIYLGIVILIIIVIIVIIIQLDKPRKGKR